MTRFVSVTVVMVVLAAGRVASAQSDPGTLPNGATIAFEHLEIFNDGKFVETEANTPTRLHYFNLAHCNCAKAKSGTEQKFSYLIHQAMMSGVHQAVGFWVGSACADDLQRNMNCKPVASIQDIDVNLYQLGGTRQDFNLYDVVNGKLHQAEACLSVEGTATIWAFVDTTGSKPDTPDYKTTQNVGTVAGETSTNGVDTKPPPLPTAIKAAPGEGQILLSWTPPTANNTDVAYYQALCAKMDGTPARPKDEDAKFVTTASICDTGADPLAKDADLMETPLDNGEGKVAMPTGQFGALSEDYICGHSSAGTASSLTITKLDNDTPYQVILVSVDLYGNYTGTYFGSTITPHLVTDFWEDLHDRGSNTEGGLCLLAETYGDDSDLTTTLRAFRDDTLGGSWLGRRLSAAYYATLAKLGSFVHGSIALRIVAAIVLTPVVVLALLWHWLTLPGLLGLLAAAWWLRRRHRGLASRWGHRLSRMRALRVAAGIAVLTLGMGRARAGGYQPYWEDAALNSNENQAAPDDPGLVKWHAGIRVGPYVPAIDKQLGGTSPGPYEQMFGGFRILPMLDVDRMLWTDFGQLGVGVSLGYFRKTAHAFAMNSDPMTAKRVREPGATNKFTLIPFELTAIYRFTWLDDEYRIPVVPYARGGLAYYAWWVNAPDGSFANVCKDGSMDAGCSQNKAYGASLGVRGAIGLALRAENIDADTANSMRQSGIQHAGVYGELSISKVDGFGSDTKLSVGDRTWFAGVDFEF